MKQNLILLFCLLWICHKAQTNSIALFHDNTTNAVAPNATLDVVTTPTDITSITIDVQNLSSLATNTYNVKRYDIAIHKSSVDTAWANFCFGGQCYSTITFTGSIPLVLNPLQNSTTAGIGNDTAYYSLDCDIRDASVIGFSLIKYTVYRIDNVNDSVQFTVRYNKELFGTGIQSQSITNSMAVYPNPVRDHVSIRVSSANNSTGNVRIFNMIGDLVYTEKFRLTLGNNKLELDLADLPAGVYLAEINDGIKTNSKKLIVE